MFTWINNLFSLGLALLLGIPFMAFVAYITAGFAQGLFGGPTWLWMIIIFVIGTGAAIEESKKLKAKNENQPQ